MAPKSKSKTKDLPSSTAKSSSTPKQSEEKPPNWPPLVPLPALEDLALTTLLPDQILTISSLFPASLCKKYVSFLSTLPLVTTPNKPKKGDAVRVNDRFTVQDPVFAERLWRETGLSELVQNASTATENDDGLSKDQKNDLWGGEVLGLNPNIRVYRYREGQFFDKHYDDSNNISFTTEDSRSVQGKTTWTLLLYLTGPVNGVEGGETVFYPEAPKRSREVVQPVVVGLEEGMALLHRHGRECMIHEGREVTKGEKWVLRSDLVVRR
ncbi:hypothetical protein MBLNU457_1572t1 [Dothideomycetes sp. NU457]